MEIKLNTVFAVMKLSVARRKEPDGDRLFPAVIDIFISIHKLFTTSEEALDCLAQCKDVTIDVPFEPADPSSPAFEMETRFRVQKGLEHPGFNILWSGDRKSVY